MVVVTVLDVIGQWPPLGHSSGRRCSSGRCESVHCEMVTVVVAVAVVVFAVVVVFELGVVVNRCQKMVFSGDRIGGIKRQCHEIFGHFLS